MSGGLMGVGIQVEKQIIYTSGTLVPATTGTYPDNYAQTGIAYDKASTEKACTPLFCPGSWTNPQVSLLCLSATFQSGDVKLRFGDEGGTDDATITVSGGFYIGNPGFSTGPSWNAGAGAFAGLKFTQYPLSRIGGDVADTLDDDFCVLALVVTDG